MKVKSLSLHEEESMAGTACAVMYVGAALTILACWLLLGIAGLLLGIGAMLVMFGAVSVVVEAIADLVRDPVPPE